MGSRIAATRWFGFTLLLASLGLAACDEDSSAGGADTPRGGVGQACHLEDTSDAGASFVACDDEFARCNGAGVCACVGGRVGANCEACPAELTFVGPVCGNEDNAPCKNVTPEHGETLSNAAVSIQYSVASGWSEPADCPWECPLGAAHDLERNACLLAFTDPGLEQCLRDELELTTGVILSPWYAEGVTELRCPNYGIKTLGGIEAFGALTTLSLWENELRDLAPLRSLTGLTTLQLGHNRIQDLSALAGMSSLTRLGLMLNELSADGALAPLAGLTSLEYLNLDGNDLSGAALEPLSTLPELIWLTLEHNQIDDLSKLVLLAEAGCDIHLEYQDEDAYAWPPSDGRGNPTESEMGATRGLQTKRPSLAFCENDAGRVELQVVDLQDGQRRRLHLESGGELRRVGDEIVYARGAVNLAIGSWSAKGEDLCTGPYAERCRLSIARKGASAEAWPGWEKPAPVFTASLTVFAEGDDEATTEEEEPPPESYDHSLLPFALASPNQLDGGSCLFMSTTGAMEILINQGLDMETVHYQGDSDLSERFLMNAGGYVPREEMRYYLTDTMYAYNVLGGSLLNRDYPFTAGYVVDTPSGGMAKADAETEGAYFSCQLNWIDELPEGWRDMLVDTPASERTSIFVHPVRDEAAKWDVGLMTEEHIERIKYELRTKRSPVIIVYNHFLYWHADIIVGYDDLLESGGCPMVEASLDHFATEGAEAYVQRIEDHKAEQGGCRSQGVFWVRDSIYDGGEEETHYSYSDDYVFEKKYSQRIIGRSYDWVKYLANHAYTMHRR